MGKENVLKFYELLQQDAAVVEELKKAGEGIDSAEKAVALLIDFAKGKGFDFTAEDIAAFEENMQRELSPEELDMINAGAWGFCLGLGGGQDGEATGFFYTDCDGWGWGIGLTWKGHDPGAAERDYKDKKANPLGDNNHSYNHHQYGC